MRVDAFVHAGVSWWRAAHPPQWGLHYLMRKGHITFEWIHELFLCSANPVFMCVYGENKLRQQKSDFNTVLVTEMSWVLFFKIVLLNKNNIVYLNRIVWLLQYTACWVFFLALKWQFERETCWHWHAELMTSLLKDFLMYPLCCKKILKQKRHFVSDRPVVFQVRKWRVYDSLIEMLCPSCLESSALFSLFLSLWAV